MRKLAFILTIILSLFLTTADIQAYTCDDKYQCDKYKDDDSKYTDCLTDQMDCWENNISTAQAEASTLQSAIDILNGQIRVQSIQIQQTISDISKLEKELEELSQRIEGLSLSLNKLSGILIKRVREGYKQNRLQYKTNFFTADSFNNFISQYRYLSEAQKQTLEVMKRTEMQRLTYNQQKELKEEKQKELDQKRYDLQSQKNTLDSQKSSKNTLLTQTKNDESIYQQKLAEATAELNALKNYAASKGGGVVSAQNSPDGWYFSQRDERWAYNKIGASSEIIMEVGCLISSTAMMMKYKGENVNPITIANNSGYFFSTTAYMNRPWPAPSGYFYSYTSRTELDSKLDRGPVIAKLSAGPYGTHFIVIKEKDDGEYIMHDPWEGYDKDFSDYYSTSQIIQIAYLSK
jgi:peptidoglycan hydrolase CwlO-like protein